MTLKTTSPIRCFIIGEGSLPVQCGQILLDRGHNVLGVASSDKTTLGWASERNIPTSNPRSNLMEHLRQQPFDYLFSIVNGVILPGEALNLPLKGAINFHDALIPRYTGTCATSWALMNQELTHGITWHLMAEKVDAGAVLKQHTIEVGERETALTLNAKCYEAAIRAFEEMLKEMECDSLAPQDQDHGGRSFFPRSKRPEAACTLAWDRPAEEIDALVRALDFGSYLNPLGAAKIFTGSEFLLVAEAQVLQEETGAAPGTISKVDASGVTVATATHPILLKKLTTIDGEPVDLFKSGLVPGVVLPALALDTVRRITEINALAARSEEYWAAALKVLQPPEIHYLERPEATQQIPQFVSTDMQVPIEYTEYCQRASLGVGSPGDCLVAAFGAYISQIAGSESVDLSWTRQELQQDIFGLEGLFASHVPIHLEVDGKAGFADFLVTAIKEMDKGRRRNTYVRDVVVRFPTLMGRGAAGLPIAIAQIESWDSYAPPAGCELALLADSRGDRCQWTFNSQALESGDVDAMVGQFATFLSNIAAEPSKPIAQLSLLTEEVRQKILADFNRTEKNYGEARCIHTLFEEQVKRAPDAHALVFKGQHLSYRGLNQRANQIAFQLRGMGVGTDTLVGICAKRSPEMVAGLMGILKAGGAYLPLDPSLPGDRLTFMLADSQVDVLLTQQALVDSLPPGLPRLVFLDAASQSDGEESETTVDPEVTPDNLAYCIYTSGSTGQPKGALLPHRGVVNFLYALRDTFQLSSVDRVLQKASISFDVSVLEVFAPLILGGTLVLADPEHEYEASYLVRLMSEEGVTFAHYVASMLSPFLDEADVETCTALRHIMCGGEVVPPELCRRFYQRLDAGLTASYGPTEASIGVTFWPVPRDFHGRAIPIGPPMANVKLYVLNEALQPVPVGVPGELCISGGLARGYLNRPELTAEKFVGNPFEPGGDILYKSGDKARYLPDGNIDFMERIDRQVKIRGLRIELGEIEAVLTARPAVRDGVVTAAESNQGDLRLVAYVVPRQGQANSITDLRTYLKMKLPEYMVPSAFVMLDVLPTTSSGKVDYQALPQVSVDRPALAGAYVAPRNPLEESLANLWTQVLNLEQVGVYDNFFELGGHSLLATQLVARMRDTFAMELPLRSIFEAPTVAGVAEWFQDSRIAEDQLPMLPLLPGSEEGPHPMSYQQERFWKMIRNPGQSRQQLLHFGLHFKGPLDPEILKNSFNKVAQRHDILHCTFGVPDGQPAQLPREAVQVPFQIVDLTQLSPAEQETRVSEICAEDAETPIDLLGGPLLRSNLIKLGDEDHVLSFEISHMVFDAWSKNLFYKEMMEQYAASLSGRPAQLATLELQHSDFARWQRGAVDGGAYDWQAKYWRQILGSGFPLLELPIDHPRPEVQTLPNLMLSAIFPPELAERAKNLSKQEGITTFCPFMVAFKVLLHSYTGQTDMVVTSLFSNRSRAEADGLIGPLLNRINLRSDFSGDPTFKELLSLARTTFMGAYTHRDYPFELLEEEFAPVLEGRGLQSRVRFWLVDASGFDSSLLPSDLLGLEVSENTMSIMQAGARGGPELSLAITLSPTELVGHWLYRSDLFDQSTIEEMMARMETLLECIVDDPAQRLSQLVQNL